MIWLALDIFSSIASTALVLVAIAVVLLIIFSLGRIIIGLIVNSILGLIAIYVINSFFNLGIVVTLPILLVVALFGLPAVLILVILRLLGFPV